MKRAEIETTLKTFLVEGQVCEIRAIAVLGKEIQTVISADLSVLVDHALSWDRAGAKGVYFTPNLLRPDMAGSQASAKTADVSRRHWLLIDCDPERPTEFKKSSATDAERQASWAVLERCKTMLDCGGLINPIVADSGNGWHLCYPVDLPADEASHELIKTTLKGLQHRCGGDQAKVDTLTHDAPRIWKLYGTTARKGENTEDRPHRESWLVSGTPWDQTAAQENSVKLQELANRWQWAEDMRRGRPTGTVKDRVKAFLTKVPAALESQPADPADGNERHGHNQTLHTAIQIVEGFHITEEADFLEVITEWNNRCVPPWTEKELKHKFRSALKKVNPTKVGRLLRDKPEDGEQAQAEPEEAKDDDIATIDDLIRCGAEISWLWPGWIQRGVLTLIAALGGTGKTRLCADLVRRIRHNMPWPDETPIALPNDSLVIWVMSDNHHDEMVTLSQSFGIKEAIRLNAPKKDPYAGVILEKPGDLEALEARIKRVKPVMVIIDTVGNSTDKNLCKQEDAKAYYQPLQIIARRQRVAILCLTHLSTAGAVLGRRATEKVRVVIKLDRPQGQDRLRLDVDKTNSKKPAPMGVTMQDGGNEYDNDPPKPVEEGGFTAGIQKGKAKLQEAIDWLKVYLKGGEVRKVGSIRGDAELVGIQPGSLYRAKDHLKIVETKDEKGKKCWHLPPDSEED